MCSCDIGVVMERIGITASKIAKGNLVWYNFYVIVIAFLLALFLFFISASAIALALVILGYILKEILPIPLEKDWLSIIYVCMVSLSVVVGIATIFAILRNIRIK